MVNSHFADQSHDFSKISKENGLGTTKINRFTDVLMNRARTNETVFEPRRSLDQKIVERAI